MREKVHPSVIRDRGAELRRIGADLASRFRASQAGTVRPGLTLEDGTLVVTDNYLKLRIPAGHRRNERISVLVTKSGEHLDGVPVADAGSCKPAAGSRKLQAGS
jgi:hypothetical protein